MRKQLIFAIFLLSSVFLITPGDAAPAVVTTAIIAGLAAPHAETILYAAGDVAETAGDVVGTAFRFGGNVASSVGDEISSWFGGRRRRSVFEAQDLSLSDREIYSRQINKVFGDIQTSDALHCGQRLLCELAQQSREAARKDEIYLYSAIHDMAEYSNNEITPSFNVYVEAMKVGENHTSCALTYSSCPFNKDMMMASIRISKAFPLFFQSN